MIVPVWVSSKNSPSSEKLYVYALLDTQSDTTFIDQEVSDGLQADTHPVRLKLTTMIGKDTVLRSTRVSGLRVRGYSSAVHIDLPPVYRKNCIPVNRTHIPTSDTAKQWKHLTVIVNEIPPLKDCEVGLLIGYNCSRALAPRKVIVGFVAPVLLIGKRILREMCRHGTSWDDPLKVELRPRWECWRSDLNNLDRIDILCSYAPTSFGKIARAELHHFLDASISGYGQCSYLRLSKEDGDVHCALVIGKSSVAPTKLTTIPMLELTTAVVSVKVSNVLKEELGYANAQEFFWTDSKVVLGYINNEAWRFHTFVANRVQRIHLSTTPQ
ncbi:hypothetical protein MHYP_G00151470 [Metynnis hypsauchen]